MKVTIRQLRRIIRESMNPLVRHEQQRIEQIKSRILVIGNKLDREFSAQDVSEQFMKYGEMDRWGFDDPVENFVRYISSSALTVKDIEDIMMRMVQEGKLTVFDPGLFEVHPDYASYHRDFPY